MNIAEFEDLNQDNLKAGINVSRLSASLPPAIEIFSTISLATIVIMGGYAITNDTITVGIFVAFILFTQRFYAPLNQLALQFTGLQNANAAASHIFELLDEKITAISNVEQIVVSVTQAMKEEELIPEVEEDELLEGEEGDAESTEEDKDSDQSKEGTSSPDDNKNKDSEG